MVSTTSKYLGAVPEKVYELTEKELWNIISYVLRNVSLPREDSLLSIPDTHSNDSTVNITTTLHLPSDEFSDDEKMTLLYVFIFFTWYGALIFGCLIGCGVYKTPGSFQTYKTFVDRQDLRDKLRREKLAERQRRKLERQYSAASTICTSPSTGSNLSMSHNGGVNFCNLYGRGSPPMAGNSTIYQEEEEGLLDDQISGHSDSKLPGSNGVVVFEL